MESINGFLVSPRVPTTAHAAQREEVRVLPKITARAVENDHRANATFIAD